MGMNNPTPLGEVDDILRPGADQNPLLDRGMATTTLDALINWARTGCASNTALAFRKSAIERSAIAIQAGSRPCD